VVVEVVDAPLEYNLLFKCTWFYEMNVVISLVFRALRFPHQVKIITIDQLVLYTPYLGSNVGSNVPFVSDTTQYVFNISAGMFKNTLIMGIFPLPPLSPTTHIDPINMIFSFKSGSLRYFYPW
jgi:hypothetical protein